MEDLRYGERRAAIDAAVDALAGIESCLWEAQTADLGPLFRRIDDLGRRVESARVAVLAEAMGRGETTGTVARAHVGWVLEWAPSLRGGGAGRLVEVALASREERHAQLREALLDGRVGVSNAAVCLTEMERLRHRLRPEAVPTVWEGLLLLAGLEGPRAIRALRPALLARYGSGDELEKLEDRARTQVRLSQPVTAADGLHEYALLLDTEGRAVLEAALGPVSAPCPTDEVPDLRPSGQRRAEGLMTLVRRAVASPESVPTSSKATVFVTIDLEALQARMRAAGFGCRGEADQDLVRGGTTVGSADAGSLLSPATMRRMACDGGVIPVVLGSMGEVLDLGREVRLFTPGQHRALWLRDRHCTIPGCSMPAQWCDAHHLVHWVDHGESEIRNGALLCGYHHSWVHTKRVAGRVVVDAERGEHVVWDLRPGSYDVRGPDPGPGGRA